MMIIKNNIGGLFLILKSNNKCDVILFSNYCRKLFEVSFCFN